jgi:tetratricopeptide (TPR) repeat protein
MTPPRPALDPGALKRARTRRGMSQTDVARLIGVPANDRNQIGRWERGSHQPQPHYQRRLWALFPELAPDAWTDVDRRAFLDVLGASSMVLADATTNLIVGPMTRAKQPATLASAADVATLTLEARRLDDQLGGARTWPLAHRLPGLALALDDTGAAADASQLCGWLCLDLGRIDHARVWLSHAQELAKAAGDRSLAAYVLGHQAVLNLHDDRPRWAARAAVAATQAARSAPPGLRSWLATVEAESHAAIGEERAALASLEQAARLLPHHDPAEAPNWLYFFGRWDLTQVEGTANLRLGRTSQARAAVQETLASTPGFIRERAVHLATLAGTYAVDKESDEAARIAGEALKLAQATGSDRGVRRVRWVAARLEGQAATDLQAQLAGKDPS